MVEWMEKVSDEQYRVRHTTTRHLEDGSGAAGTVMTIALERKGQQFVALNGGPGFPFTKRGGMGCVTGTSREIFIEFRPSSG